MLSQKYSTDTSQRSVETARDLCCAGALYIDPCAFDSESKPERDRVSKPESDNVA